MIALLLCITATLIAAANDVDESEPWLVYGQISMVLLGLAEVVTLDFFLWNCWHGFGC